MADLFMKELQKRFYAGECAKLLTAWDTETSDSIGQDNLVELEHITSDIVSDIVSHPASDYPYQDKFHVNIL